MNYDKKTIRDIDVSGKKILLRCDFNVPHDKATGVIHDDTRIVSTLPTIRYLLDHNAAVILLSHMGRPHGEWKKELSLFSARDHLEELLEMPVPLTEDVLGPDTKAKCAALQPGEVVLVENLRFRLEEEKNDPEFAKELASLADIFVFDAFGAAHRVSLGQLLAVGLGYVCHLVYRSHMTLIEPTGHLAARKGGHAHLAGHVFQFGQRHA